MTETRYEKVEFDRFGEQVFAHQSKLVDVYDRLDGIGYQAGGHVTIPAHGANIASDCNETGYFKLCEKLGAPAGWMLSKRCPGDLEETIVNRLKKDVDGEYLFRLRYEPDGQVLRSVLTERYLTYNHWDLWRDAQQIFEREGMEQLHPVIWKPKIDDNLDMWILFNSVNADPNTNNPQSYDGGGYGGLKPAIHIRNSEDGTGSVRIAGGMYRSYCTNGVIFGWKEEQRMRQVHMGQRWAMKGYVWHALTLAMSKANKGIDLYIAATEMELGQEIDSIVKRWTSKYALSVETSKLWSKAVEEAQPRTVADFVMATSDFAGYQSRDITTTMEEMAGAMLEARSL